MEEFNTKSITSVQPTLWYWHCIDSNGHIFKCSSMSPLVIMPISHLLGQGKGNLGHCFLCFNDGFQ